MGVATFENAPLGTVCYLKENREYNNSYQDRQNFLEYCAKVWNNYYKNN